MNFAILGFGNVFVFIFELLCGLGIHFKQMEDASMCLEELLYDSHFLYLFSALLLQGTHFCLALVST